MNALNANAEPVFFSYRANEDINAVLKQLVLNESAYDFVADDGIRHELWVVGDRNIVAQLESLFSQVPDLYVADGHHRTAAAARIGQHRKNKNPNHTGEEEYNLFLAVLFSDQELEIFDYNRVIKDLNGLTDTEFVDEIKSKFHLLEKSQNSIKPQNKGEFSVYLNKFWYLFSALERDVEEDPVKSLDVSYLSDHIFDAILGIVDQRKDDRIDFVGGIRGLDELKRRVDSGDMAVAFALYPVSMDELLKVAVAGEIMPPK